MSDPAVTTVIKCPHCGKTIPWIESQTFRPFCSRRCKMIDFGDWAFESHSIPGDSVNLDLQDDID